MSVDFVAYIPYLVPVLIISPFYHEICGKVYWFWVCNLDRWCLGNDTRACSGVCLSLCSAVSCNMAPKLAVKTNIVSVSLNQCLFLCKFIVVHTNFLHLLLQFFLEFLIDVSDLIPDKWVDKCCLFFSFDLPLDKISLWSVVHVSPRLWALMPLVIVYNRLLCRWFRPFVVRVWIGVNHDAVGMQVL